MSIKGRKSKNPPILSHEFIIQNHADIVSTLIIIILLGLMFKVFAPISSAFVAPSHSITSHSDVHQSYFIYGFNDLHCIFFYLLICILFHAVLQEFVIDKVNRKLHLSKTKSTKFTDSGQLLAFFLVSIVWGSDLILKENYLFNIPLLWEGYPHIEMSASYKLFFILQISYWLHILPELYLQKTKKEDRMERIYYSMKHLTYIIAAYIFCYTRISLCLLVGHYFVEVLFHISQILNFADKKSIADIGCYFWNIFSVLIRLGSVTLSVLTFWYGLASSDSVGLDIRGVHFNGKFLRISALLALCFLQACLMWNFITYHLQRRREQAADRIQEQKKQVNQKFKKNKNEVKGNSEEDVNELPEVDQNTKKNLKNRQSYKSK